MTSTAPTTWVAVADLHGHLDHLRALLEHLDATLGGDYGLCTLGDYVDNGAQVPELLDALIELRAARGPRFAPILGNHDLAFLRALGWPGDEPDEVWFGRWSSRYWDPGLGTPRVYARARGEPEPRSAAEFARWFPEDHPHRRFLASLPWFHDTGELLFVHAGMAPGDLEPQRQLLAARQLPAERTHLPAQLRDKALSCVGDPGWDRLVVSAHNKRIGGPRFEGPNRICLSGELDATGVLHAVVLPDRRWISVDRKLRVAASGPPRKGKTGGR